MPDLPFGEWLPDLPAHMNPGLTRLVNALPVSKTSYGPVKHGQPFTGTPMPEPVVGAYSHRSSDLAIHNVAGTQHSLREMKTGQTDYTDVSKAGGYHTENFPDGFWQIWSYGDLLIATNYVDPVQYRDSMTVANFADLAAAAPRARYGCAIKDFLMLGNTADEDGAKSFRVRWSGVGNPFSWPAKGTDAAIRAQSDFQDLVQTDLGPINGLVGGHLSAADGAVLCEEGIWRIGYSGSPKIFDFQVAQGATGTSMPLSIVTRHLRTSGGAIMATIFYRGTDGFYAFDGGNSAAIGSQKVDDFFLNELDPNYTRAVQGMIQPQRKFVSWLYHGPGHNGYFNRLIAYSWELDRWGFADLSSAPVQFAGAAYSVGGYNLDQLDPFGNLDQLKFSLDSRVWVDGEPLFAWFGQDGRLYYSTGTNMAPTFETGDLVLFPDRRSRIQSTRPIADGGPATITIGTKELLYQPVVYQPGVPENVLGDCPQNCTGRFTRFRLTLPDSTPFTHIQGLKFKGRPEGRLR